jgi:hypothetical protein
VIAALVCPALALPQRRATFQNTVAVEEPSVKISYDMSSTFSQLYRPLTAAICMPCSCIEQRAVLSNALLIWERGRVVIVSPGMLSSS